MFSWYFHGVNNKNRICQASSLILNLNLLSDPGSFWVLMYFFSFTVQRLQRSASRPCAHRSPWKDYLGNEGDWWIDADAALHTCVRCFNLWTPRWRDSSDVTTCPGHVQRSHQGKGKHSVYAAQLRQSASEWSPQSCLFCRLDGKGRRNTKQIWQNASVDWVGVNTFSVNT